MKMYSLCIRLIALLAISSMAYSQASAADGIAAAAFKAQAERSRIPHTAPTNVAKETGIKTSGGTLIHPVIQNSEVNMPVPSMRPQQEDYHTQQL